MKKFLLSVICFISIMSCNVFAKEQSLSVAATSGDDVPIVYSGKYYTNTNTSNITVKDFDVSKGIKFNFPDGVKVASYKIVDSKGIKGISKESVKVTSENSNEELNTVYINNLNKINDEIPEIIIEFTVVVSPTYNGDINVSVGEHTALIAKTATPLIIETAGAEKNIDFIKTPKTNIIIKESYDGALEKGSVIALKPENMDFLDDYSIKVNSGNLNLSNTINNGAIIINVDNDLSNIPAEIEISNVVTSSKPLDAGVYGLFTLATDFVDIENNEVKQKGKDAMFETYFNGNKDYLPVFDVNEFELKNDFVKIIDPLANYNKLNKFDKHISLKIGSNILNIDGTENIMDSPAYISNSGYTMMPVRSIVDALTSKKAHVDWYPDKNKVIITYEEKTIDLTIGSDIMYINGIEYSIGTPAEISKDRIFIPLRDLCYAFGIPDKNIIWDSVEQTVKIN